MDLNVDQAEAGNHDFRHWRMAEDARLLERGRGHWWAAWRDGLPVCSAGLYRGDGLARYQEVANYITAVQHVLNPDRRLPLRLPLLREAHEILSTGVRGGYATQGEFRRS